MTKWLLSEDNDLWTVTVKGRLKVIKNSEASAKKWLKKKCLVGDTIWLQESDGFLSNITRSISH